MNPGHKHIIEDSCSAFSLLVVLHLVIDFYFFFLLFFFFFLSCVTASAADFPPGARHQSRTRPRDSHRPCISGPIVSLLLLGKRRSDSGFLDCYSLPESGFADDRYRKKIFCPLPLAAGPWPTQVSPHPPRGSRVRLTRFYAAGCAVQSRRRSGWHSRSVGRLLGFLCYLLLAPSFTVNFWVIGLASHRL